MSTAPMPRPWSTPVAGTDSHASPPRLTRISPANVFGSVATSVASAPVISTTPIRSSGVSKLNVAWATAPDSNSYRAAT